MNELNLTACTCGEWPILCKEKRGYMVTCPSMKCGRRTGWRPTQEQAVADWFRMKKEAAHGSHE